MQSATYADLDPILADAIAQEFVNHEASPEWVKDVATRWHSTESDVTAIAHDVADGTFKGEGFERLRRSIIFESAPQPKGTTTMGNRTAAQLTKAEIQGITKIMRVNGTSPTIVANVIKQYNITEATGEAFATVINEPAPKPRAAVTEATLPPGVSRAVYEAAVELDAGGEPDLTGLSVGDLQSLTGAVCMPLISRN